MSDRYMLCRHTLAVTYPVMVRPDGSVGPWPVVRVDGTAHRADGTTVDFYVEVNLDLMLDEADPVGRLKQACNAKLGVSLVGWPHTVGLELHDLLQPWRARGVKGDYAPLTAAEIMSLRSWFAALPADVRDALLTGDFSRLPDGGSDEPGPLGPQPG